MTRREIFSLTLTALTGAHALRIFASSIPGGYVQAVPARYYPGAVRKLKPQDLLKPSKWAG